MKGLVLARCVLSHCVAAAMLVSCGQLAQLANAPQKAARENGAVGAAHANRGDLIYVLSSQRESGGYILAYPSGQLVGHFGFPSPHFFSYGICSDTKGDVFATVGGVDENYIFEYGHGGTSPIETLTTYALPVACAVDPNTGNLAVVNAPYGSGGASIAVYRNARGTPHLYNDKSFNFYASCDYDRRGNLFVVGSPLSGGEFALAELPKGGNTFTNISLNKKLGHPGAVQWDGTNLTLQDRALVKGHLGANVIYRVQVAGSKARILGATQFRDWRRRGGFTILRGSFVGVWGAQAESIGYWRYPLGGQAYKVTKGFGYSQLGALTISRAPH